MPKREEKVGNGRSASHSRKHIPFKRFLQSNLGIFVLGDFNSIDFGLFGGVGYCTVRNFN